MRSPELGISRILPCLCNESRAPETSPFARNSTADFSSHLNSRMQNYNSYHHRQSRSRVAPRFRFESPGRIWERGSRCENLDRRWSQAAALLQAVFSPQTFDQYLLRSRTACPAPPKGEAQPSNRSGLSLLPPFLRRLLVTRQLSCPGCTSVPATDTAICSWRRFESGPQDSERKVPGTFRRRARPRPSRIC